MFLNHYKCGDCAHEWDDVYECTVDDDCPNCNSRHYTPVWSTDEGATYERFLLCEPAEDSEQAHGPFPDAESRDKGARELVTKHADRRVFMLDIIQAEGRLIPVAFAYSDAMLEPTN